jgi:hypothetical protein
MPRVRTIIEPMRAGVVVWRCFTTQGIIVGGVELSEVSTRNSWNYTSFVYDEGCIIPCPILD